MEISLRMNPKIATILVPKPHKTRPGRKAYDHDFKAISCRADDLAMKKKNMTNYYEVLCLGSVNVGHDEIKKAYRTLALQCHPDVCPPPAKEESTRRFVELQKAYESLSNPWVWSNRWGLETREEFIEKKVSPDFPRKYGKSSSLV